MRSTVGTKQLQLDWHRKVYREKASGSGLRSYRMTLCSLARRLQYVCEGCRKKFARGKLSIHHIIPRPDGADDPKNLMLLCHPCHDLAEEYGRGTRADVISYIQDETARVKTKPKPLGQDWHQWVYGGHRNPHLDVGYGHK